MDKQLLRPRELCVEPGAPDAGRAFAFWLRTAEDFIDSLRELRRDGDPEVNRKRIFLLVSILVLKTQPTMKM